MSQARMRMVSEVSSLDRIEERWVSRGGLDLSFQRTWRWGWRVRTIRKPVANSRASSTRRLAWVPRLTKIVGFFWSQADNSGSTSETSFAGSSIGPAAVMFLGITKGKSISGRAGQMYCACGW